MQLGLELLAPAGNAEIGIAAIDCGADAVYIAGPAFGARAAAGNPVEEVARLCRHARLYGVKVHATVNTLLRPEERGSARDLMCRLYEAGVDAFIVQDLNLLSLDLPPAELHASTQTAIRTPERARELEALGFSRLVLERQLTLDEIRAIRAAVSCELEFFIHGALCVGYSGQCYLSQYLAGRSANRGVCAQACRSRYDLSDADGRILFRDQTLLSPRDLRFDAQVPDLVEAGITSFKIEGRLKNAAYVKNNVRYYRDVLDRYIAAHPACGKTSAGRMEGGFDPDPDRSFTRGWTTAMLTGRSEKMGSGDAAKALGEPVGEIAAVRGSEIVVRGSRNLSNGDGLSFVGRNGSVTGMRAEVVRGDRITVRDTDALRPGMRVYRSRDIRFERELENNMPHRVIDVSVSWHTEKGETTVSAATGSGESVLLTFSDDAPQAEKPETACEGIRRQLGKHTGPFAFSLEKLEADSVRFYAASFLNRLRRELADRLQQQLEHRSRPLHPHVPQPDAGARNLSVHGCPDDLLRSRFCIRWEKGLCPKQHPKQRAGGGPAAPLYLINQQNRLEVVFDCARCEMVIRVPDRSVPVPEMPQKLF